MFGSGEDGPEVRDYVYLDSGSLDSWYASMHGWVPESRQQQDGKEYTGEANVGAKGELTSPFAAFLAKLGFDGELGGSITGQRMTETADRVIDQGLHTQLREELVNEGMILPITEDLEPGDVVEVTGSGGTDPLYRLILALQRLIAVDDLEDISAQLEELQPAESNDEPRPGIRPGMQDEFDFSGPNAGADLFGGENMIEQVLGQQFGSKIGPSRSEAIGESLQQALSVIYGDDICLMLDIDEDETEDSDGTYPKCGMLLSEAHLETGPRDFLSEKKYTVLGRVVETHQDGKWNYAELLRVAGDVMNESDVDELRESFEESMQDMSSSDDVSVDAESFTANDPVVVIKPVAVYW
ncbi:DUF6414 family protein [Halomarina oriensis]|uniref:Uncharacterized protein n=1 Tax=Halomarina oriensis TaxID=671145 RepID=A0A6B0GU10_9EURY|nr:hypothetical protein [Halomarina oriensis]MWG36093.1 hypothetical protein [Halomarina oriensis]